MVKIESMATVSFHKYQGTGNDFVIIDNRQLSIDPTNLKWITQLCDRRFGIGADGLILIQNHAQADFEMVYFNPDGSQSLCGNGSRCAVMFARSLGIITNQTVFYAIDGLHNAFIDNDQVHLKMNDVTEWHMVEKDYVLDTGSPHYLRYVKSTESVDVVQEGRSVRNQDAYRDKGINVNFLEQVKPNALKIRTYERGVEAETLSCGTGCTAAALSLHMKNGVEKVTLYTRGGDLKVHFTKTTKGFENVYLIGPAKFVFKGEVVL